MADTNLIQCSTRNVSFVTNASGRADAEARAAAYRADGRYAVAQFRRPGFGWQVAVKAWA